MVRSKMVFDMLLDRLRIECGTHVVIGRLWLDDLACSARRLLLLLFFEQRGLGSWLIARQQRLAQLCGLFISLIA